MPRRPATRSAAALLVACVLSAGCGSAGSYERERSAAMLRVYPPGQTTRADVRARWPGEPDVTALRGDAGWAGVLPQRAAARAAASERRTGKAVARVERYSGPDTRGVSTLMSLCHGWFYFDADDRVVDVEWEYMSD